MPFVELVGIKYSAMIFHTTVCPFVCKITLILHTEYVCILYGDPSCHDARCAVVLLPSCGFIINQENNLVFLINLTVLFGLMNT